MPIPLELSYRHLEPSDFIEEKVQQRCKKLESLSHEITSCHVVLSSPHHQHSKGHQYEVSIELRVPGNPLVVTHSGKGSHSHEDFYVALRDAFDAMESQLIRWKDKRRHDVKAHSRPAEPDLPNE